jgi:hypothetical protein
MFYELRDSSAIERCYTARKPECFLPPGGEPKHRVDFERMLQVNLHTEGVRQVRRRQDDERGGGGGGGECDMVWAWVDDGGQAHYYHHPINVALEAAFRAPRHGGGGGGGGGGGERVEVSAAHVVDTRAMRQERRDDSRRYRRVIRIPAAEAVANAVAAGGSGGGGSGGGGGGSAVEGAGCSLEWWCDGGCPADATDLVLVPAALYAAWAVPYFLALFVCCEGRIAAAKKETLFSFLVGDPAFKWWLLAVPDRPNLLRPLAYLAGHFLMMVGLGCLSLVFWHSFWAHAAFLAALGVAVIREVRRGVEQMEQRSALARCRLWCLWWEGLRGCW